MTDAAATVKSTPQQVQGHAVEEEKDEVDDGNGDEEVKQQEPEPLSRERLLARCRDKRRQLANGRRPKTAQDEVNIAPGSELTVRNKKERREIMKQRFDQLKEIIDTDNVKELANAQSAKDIEKRYQKERNQLALLEKTDFNAYKRIKKEIETMAQFRTRDMGKVRAIVAEKIAHEVSASPLAKMINSFREEKREKKEKKKKDAGEEIKCDVPLPDSDEEELVDDVGGVGEVAAAAAATVEHD